MRLLKKKIDLLPITININQLGYIQGGSSTLVSNIDIYITAQMEYSVLLASQFS